VNIPTRWTLWRVVASKVTNVPGREQYPKVGTSSDLARSVERDISGSMIASEYVAYRRAEYRAI
jgi:hypothetical protein